MMAATDVGDLVDWTRVQALDSNIRQCIEYLQANKKPHKKETGHNPMISWYPPLDFSNVRKSMQTNSNGEEVTMGSNGAL
jgi:hypothetical protein